MATLVPRDLKTAPGVRPADAQVGEKLGQQLPEADWVYYNSPKHSDRPRFIVLSQHYGIVGVDVYDWSPLDIADVSPDRIRMVGSTTADPVSDLSRRLDGLRANLQGLQARPAPYGLIVFPNFKDSDLGGKSWEEYLPPRLGVSGESLSNGQWMAFLKRMPQPLAPEAVNEIRGRLYPETQFERVRLVQDPDQAERIEYRLRLDGEQEALARSLGSGVTVLSGVAGSGKSLVLCARARFLASEHEDWNIQILCYNRALVRYLRALVGDGCQQVSVNTFHFWAGALGIKLPFLSGDDADERMEAVVRSAIDRGVGAASCDAMLVDEGQDFPPSWIELACRAVKPKRGGMVIATDMAQCIYCEHTTSPNCLPDEVNHVLLGRNYRNTEQIGKFALYTVFGTLGNAVRARESSDGTRTPAPAEFATVGERVQVVYAGCWDEQAEFIAKEITRLVTERRATYRDIAVLYTQRPGIEKRLRPALELVEVPYFCVGRDAQSKNGLDVTENSVKLVTVHSAKGLEFPFVFIMGMEALKVPESIVDASETDANLIRLAYVGMTRAQDVLYLTYTRHNPILERAMKCTEWCDFRNYPTDYDF